MFQLAKEHKSLVVLLLYQKLCCSTKRDILTIIFLDKLVVLVLKFPDLVSVALVVRVGVAVRHIVVHGQGTMSEVLQTKTLF